MSLVDLCSECLNYRHRCACVTPAPEASQSGWPERNDRPKCPCGAPALPGGWCQTCTDDIAEAATDRDIDNEMDRSRDREQERADWENDRRFR